jgi:hypothetical protein
MCKDYFPSLFSSFNSTGCNLFSIFCSVLFSKQISVAHELAYAVSNWECYEYCFALVLSAADPRGLGLFVSKSLVWLWSAQQEFGMINSGT